MTNYYNARRIFAELFEGLDTDTQISLWNEHCDRGYYESDKIREFDINQYCSEKGIDTAEDIADFVIDNFSFANALTYRDIDYYQDHESSGSTDNEFFSMYHVLEHIEIDELFDDWNVWENQEIFNDYADDIAYRCGITDDNGIFGEFLYNEYDVTNVPEDYEKIKKDFEKYEKEYNEN